MTLLLDTQILLWAASDSDRLSEEARNLLDDPTTKLMFSTASIWEVVIKSALGRDDFRVDPRRLHEKLIDNGYGELSIESEHALEVGSLPSIHKDPFDRLLIAQAHVEKMTLLTADGQIAHYPGLIRLV